MKNFETITEKEILYHAYHAVLDKMLKEEERAKAGSKIAEARYPRYKAQYDEIHARILEIESNEKNATA